MNKLIPAKGYVLVYVADAKNSLSDIDARMNYYSSGVVNDISDSKLDYLIGKKIFFEPIMQEDSINISTAIRMAFVKIDNIKGYQE